MPSDVNAQLFNTQRIVQGDVAQLRQLLTQLAGPATTDVPRRALAERMLAAIFDGDQLDAAFTRSLQDLRAAFVQHCANQDDFYTQANHPLRQVFECLLARGRTWYPRDSKPSQQFFEKITSVVGASLNSLVGNNPARAVAALADFQQWLDSEDKRAALLETRLCETEINHLKTVVAEYKVVDVINQSLANKQFPVTLIDGLGLLKSELLHCLFTAGSDSAFWKTWQRLLPLLGYVFAAGEVDEQQLYRNIPLMLNELERSLKNHTGTSEFYQQWLNELSECLMLTVKKQTPECVPLAPLPYPEGHANLNTRVTDVVLQQVNNIQPGDWILFSGESDTIIRCKLALKNTDVDQLLFVDNTGRKVMVKTTKDFSVCLSTGIAKPLHSIDLGECIAELIDGLLDTYQHQQLELQTRADEKKQKAQVVAELQHKLASQQQAKAKAEADRKLAEENTARRAAAQKAMAEARALAEEKARRQAASLLAKRREDELQFASQAAEQMQRMQLASIQISALNLGARVELMQGEQLIKCKLAVIIAATGKYIFADNLGRKIAELQREQLVQALLDKRLILINNGDSFDDQLVKVIRSLRKDIS